MPRHAAEIVLSADERSSLEHLIRSPSTPQLLAQRARMIVMAGAGAGVQETASQLGVWRKTVSHWRKRWLIWLEKSVIRDPLAVAAKQTRSCCLASAKGIPDSSVCQRNRRFPANRLAG